MIRGDGLVLFLLAVLVGAVFALAKLFGVLSGKIDQVLDDQVLDDQVLDDQVLDDQVLDDQVLDGLSEFDLAIIQCAGEGLKGHRLVVRLRDFGILSNRETVRKKVNNLRKRGFYV